jgi:hypothetical protein
MQGAGTLAGGGGPFFRGSWLLVFSSVKECEIIKSQITNHKFEIPRCPNFLTGPAFPVFPSLKENRGVPSQKSRVANSFAEAGCWFLASMKECEIIKSQITNQKSEIPRCPNFLTGPAFPVFPIPQRKSGCPLAKISRGQFFRGSGCWFLASVKECEIIKIANHKSQI